MDKIAELLEKLATKLGVTVEYLWPFLVERTKYEWLGEMISSFLVLVIGIIFLLVANKIWNKSPNVTDVYGETEPPLLYVFLAPGVVMSVVGIMSVFITLSQISAFLCPEATTVINLLALAK